MLKVTSKFIIKCTAVLVLALEAYWTFYLNKEPHAMAIAGAIATLFGTNSAHEHIQTYLKQDIEK